MVNLLKLTEGLDMDEFAIGAFVGFGMSSAIYLVILRNIHFRHSLELFYLRNEVNKYETLSKLSKED